MTSNLVSLIIVKTSRSEREFLNYPLISNNPFVNLTQPDLLIFFDQQTQVIFEYALGTLNILSMQFCGNLIT